MLTPNYSRKFVKYSLTLVGLATLLSIVASSAVLAQDLDAYANHVRVMESDITGLNNPAGLGYSSGSNTFHVLETPGATQFPPAITDIVQLTPYADRVGLAQIAEEIEDPVNTTFDDRTKRLLILQPSTNTLLAIAEGVDGRLDPTTLVRYDARFFGVQNPQGMAIDATNGHLLILDSALPGIVRLVPATSGSFGGVTGMKVALQSLGLVEPHGLAYDPASGHLHILSTGTQELIEVTQTGQLTAVRDLSGFGFSKPRGMVFAPSGDLTDDPGQMNLYIADSGPALQNEPIAGPKASELAAPSMTSAFKARAFLPWITDHGSKPVARREGSIVELSFSVPSLSATSSVGIAKATLLQTINTYEFLPPNPDPAGIAYLASSGTLLISDSEVEETDIFAGVNLFEMSLAGTLSATYTTTFSNEPTGVDEAPDGRLFFSDDDLLKIFEVDVGGDGHFGGGDDTFSSFGTAAFGSMDPEGVTYDPDQNVLFIIDGMNREVYRVAPGPNGKFDGVDDDVTQFDTLALGIDDPEGIVYDPVNRYLYIASRDRTLLFHVSLSGTLVRIIDISEANAFIPDGLAYAPASSGPGNSIYLTDRGRDSGPGNTENDGRVFELSVPALTAGNISPTVDAGADQNIAFPAVASLDGAANDDGIPGPLTTAWSSVSGPGLVSFASTSSLNTTAGFSLPGLYVLRLMADDGELAAGSTVTITVTGNAEVTVLDIPVVGTSDDAEEILTNINLVSPDLDLLRDGDVSTNLILVTAAAVRFTGVTIPPKATIANAYVQFEVDKTSSGDTNYTVEGQAADNAPTFVNTANNITLRPRTSESVSGPRPAWTGLDEAGDDQRTENIAAIIQEIVDRPGWSSGNALAIIITGSSLNRRVAKSFDRDGLSGAPTLHVEFYTGNLAPIVNAGPDQIVTFPNSAALDGTVTDDGLPPPVMITTTWSKVSGPGTVTFGDPRATDTTANFSEEGTYILRLTAGDGQQSTNDQVTVTANTAPAVDAGLNQSVLLPGNANLDGTVSDDGFPIPPGTLTTTWSKVSGPGTVTFGSPNLTTTTASFSAGGIYVVQLLVGDGHLSASDLVTVSVNSAPSVNAGANQNVSLPNIANLSGTVSDDGFPDPPGTVTTTWSMASGPGTVTFADAGAVDTTASFSEAGVYTLRLAADDSQQSTNDEVQITVDSGTTTIEVQVAASSDDAEERESGFVSLTSPDLDILLDKDDATPKAQVAIGIRFNGVDIPRVVEIVNAYVQFQTEDSNSETTQLTIHGEASDNAMTFVKEDLNISSRNKTSASESWSPEPWNDVGEAGPKQRTPNIASVIQEIVNRSGWSANNSLVIIITGNPQQTRSAEAYDGSESGAPRLVVEYREISVEPESYLPVIAAP